MKNKPKTSSAPVPATPEFGAAGGGGHAPLRRLRPPTVAPTEPARPGDRRAAGGYVFGLRNEQTTL